jgi:hypothetical protein
MTNRLGATTQIQVESSKTSDPDLVSIIKKMLGDHDCKEPFYPLIDLAERIDFNWNNVKGKIKWYKWPGMILLVAIPLLATFVSVLLAEGATWAKYFSYVLTLLALFSSIFRPRERFLKCCDLEMQIAEFRDEYLAELEKRLAEGKPVEKDKLLDFGLTMSHQFALLQRKLFQLFLPEAFAGSDRKVRIQRSTDKAA